MPNLRESSPTRLRRRVFLRTIFALPRSVLSLFAGCLCLQASNFSIDHEAKVQYDLGGTQVPVWSGGALLSFVSNQTPAPTILSFDDRGHQLAPLVVAIPESETLALDDASRGSAGAAAGWG